VFPVLFINLERPGILKIFEMILEFVKDIQDMLRFPFPGFRHLFNPLDLPFDHFQVPDLQFQVNNLTVANGIDRTFDMRDRIIIEAPQDVDNGVGLLDIGQELVPAFRLAASLGEPRNVYDLHRCRHDLRTFDQLVDLVKPLIGDVNGANVGFESAACMSTGIGETIENRCLTYERQPDYTAFESHGWFDLLLLYKDKNLVERWKGEKVKG
jgi:hypothetical protein